MGHWDRPLLRSFESDDQRFNIQAAAHKPSAEAAPSVFASIIRPSRTPSTDSIINLQHTQGNQFVCRMLMPTGNTIQRNNGGKHYTDYDEYKKAVAPFKSVKLGETIGEEPNQTQTHVQELEDKDPEGKAKGILDGLAQGFSMSGNIASGVLTLAYGDDSTEELKVSGVTSGGGGAADPYYITGPAKKGENINRSSDSETKIYENLTGQVMAKAKLASTRDGITSIKMRLYTYYATCLNCATTSRQFKQKMLGVVKNQAANFDFKIYFRDALP